MSESQEEADRKFRENIIHSLRSRGWSRMDAEDLADERLQALRDRRAAESAS